MTITLTGQPLSTQHCYRSTTANGYNRSYMTQKCVDLKEAWQWEARNQWRQPPLEGAVAVVMTLYHGDRRQRDIDNYNKLAFDALAGIVYGNDGQIVSLTVRKQYDKERPRIELCVAPVG